MVQKIGQITDGEVMINGTDVKGRVKELDTGKLKYKEVEHSSLGMIAVMLLPGRPLEAVKGKIKFSWLDEEVERDLLDPTKLHRLQIHSYVDVFDENGLNAEKSHTLVTHLGFHTLERGGFTQKLGDPAGTEYDITIPQFSQKVYGEQKSIVQLDVHAGVYTINDKPVFPR